MNAARPIVEGYWEYVDERGGDTNPYRMAFTQIICVSETDAAAEREYREAVEYFYRNTNRVSRGFAGAPGYRSRRSMQYELDHRPSTQAELLSAIRGEMAWDDYLKLGFVIAGSPETVRGRLRELATELRVGQLIATLHMGNLSEAQAKKNTYLFATEVMPHLRDLWSDYEDHWMPAGAPVRAPAAAPAGGD